MRNDTLTCCCASLYDLRASEIEFNCSSFDDTATTCHQSGIATGKVAYSLIVTSFSLGSVYILDLLLCRVVRYVKNKHLLTMPFIVCIINV